MSEGKNVGSEPQNEQKEKPKLNEEQYKLLLSCSEKEDVTDWNIYRVENRNEEIELVEANLQGVDLDSANLQAAFLFDANLQGAWLSDVNLQGANLQGANLQDAYLMRANLRRVEFWETNLQSAFLVDADLQGASLSGANLQGADLVRANLQNVTSLLKEANLPNANLQGANLKRAKLEGANLQGASLSGANLQGANLEGANLQGANLSRANMQGAKLCGAKMQDVSLWGAKLQGADFTMAIVDGETLIWECKVNRYSKNGRFTDFEGVGLDSVRIDPETKQLLEYNVRRKNWEEWYKGKSKSKWIIRIHRLATNPISLFWSISDYGLSTGRIILTFFALAIIFATVYFVLGAVDYYFLGIKDEPGIVKNLFIKTSLAEPTLGIYYSLMVYFRAVYFSIVTMTTLGFGDMYANDMHFGFEWWLGHSLLILQVILGYVLLGALVTRFAVLFTTGGPAGTFTPMDKETKILLGELNTPIDKETKAKLKKIIVLSRKLKKLEDKEKGR